MNWVEEQFERRVNSGRQQSEKGAQEAKLEALIEKSWAELVHGISDDVGEFKRLGGDADLEKIAENEYRVSNAGAGIAARIKADFNAHTVQYTFEAETNSIAVPEGGFFSLRRSGSQHAAEIYSADQRISSEQARRMVLEPMLFQLLLT